jgi:hypothetical protein
MFRIIVGKSHSTGLFFRTSAENPFAPFNMMSLRLTLEGCEGLFVIH